MKSCSLCKQSLPLQDFNRKSSSKDGLQNVCRECNKDRSKQYHKENYDAHRTAIRENTKRYAEAARKYIFGHLSKNPCVDCGNDDIRVLEFDHVKGNKRAGVGHMVRNGFSLASIQTEIAKCEVRCRNCHQIQTYERAGNVWINKMLAELD